MPVESRKRSASSSDQSGSRGMPSGGSRPARPTRFAVRSGKEVMVHIDEPGHRYSPCSMAVIFDVA